MCISYGIVGGIVLAIISKYIRPVFDTKWAYRLLKYGSYSFLGGVSSVFYYNIDKILINRYMTTADVGLYVVYNYSFTLAVLFPLAIFETVFFPFASKYPDKVIILKKINKIITLVIIFGYPLMVCTGFIVLKLFGPAYPFNLSLGLLFGVVGIVIFLDKVYGTLMNSVGIHGKRIVSLAAIILALANVFLNFLLIPLIGIEGSIIATIISFLLSISIMLSKIKYIYKPEVI
jgi:O-antigen/teichoic acid export membrane protein